MKKYNDFFEDLTNDMPFVKIGIEGFSGTGKTFLATDLAIGLHKKIGSTKPIVIYDTEKAFRALTDVFRDAGVPVKIKKSRSLTDLSTTFDACESGYSDILIVDSITHVWEEFKNAYLANKSKRYKRKITKLAFNDWGYLKPEWKKRFSDRVVNGSLHIIFTGRAGYEYDHEEDEETGKMTELKKTGIKMKAESETAYEPDVLVLVERHEEVLGKEKNIWRTASILKDRYRIIDGKTFKNARYKDFAPMIEKALDGKYAAQSQETPDRFDELDSKNKEWIKRRDVAIEEIEATFPQLGLGTGAADKKIKIDIMEHIFSSKSWTKIKSYKVDDLEAGKKLLDQFKDEYLDYLERCSNTSEPVNKNMAYEILDRVAGPKNLPV